MMFLIGIILAYLLGSIPSSVWIGRIFFKIDVREHGSGNAGATNTIRVLGTVPGLIVLLLDLLKGFAAVKLGAFFISSDASVNQIAMYELFFAAAALLGHIFPIYVGFKGGKGVATLFGVLLALFPLTFLMMIGIFIITLLITSYVSVSSMIAAVACPFLTIFVVHEKAIPLIILSILVAIFIPLTHRKNIKRLREGTESKFKFKSKGIVNKLQGKVVHGEKIGRKLGFPTANLELNANSKMPTSGVYAVRATIDKQRYNGVMNVGLRPSFGNTKLAVEVHLFDFSNEIYDSEMDVEIIKFIREERKFETEELLIAQIKQDVEEAKNIL